MVSFIYIHKPKDRWNWKKIWRIVFYVITTPIALGLIIWGGVFLYSTYEERPKLITSYKGIELGESLNDVNFKIGGFENIEQMFITRETAELNKLKNKPEYEAKNKSLLDHIAQQKKNIGHDGDYYNESNRTTIIVLNNKIIDITHVCSDYDYSGSVSGISCKSSGDKILEKFSGEIRILCSSGKDESSRVYDAIKYGVRYFLTRNVVDGIMIANPKLLESYIGNHWVKCD